MWDTTIQEEDISYFSSYQTWSAYKNEKLLASNEAFLNSWRLYAPISVTKLLIPIKLLVHVKLLTHCTDSHCPPCCRCEHSNQFCTCSAPAMTPDQNGTFGQCSIAVAALRCSEEVQIAPQCNLLHINKIAFEHGVMLSRHSTISQPHPSAETIRAEGPHHEWANGIISALGGVRCDDINFFGGRQNCSWELH